MSYYLPPGMGYGLSKHTLAITCKECETVTHVRYTHEYDTNAWVCDDDEMCSECEREFTEKEVDKAEEVYE